MREYPAIRDDPDPAAVDEDTILSRLLALNLERSA
jgi:hypothetical protein